MPVGKVPFERQVQIRVTSVTAGRETPRAENYEGTSTSGALVSVHTFMFTINPYKLYALAIPRHLRPLRSKSDVRIVASAPDLYSALS